MPSFSEKLAQSLEKLHQLQRQGRHTIRSSDLTRTHRERLCRNGFLQEVIKGWYIPSRPDETKGESTIWYASYWQFCVDYLETRMGNNWCLSPEQSISIHVQNWQVPHQLIIRTTNARNNVTKLPHGTSLFDIKLKLPDQKNRTSIDGLRIYALPAALVACSSKMYVDNSIDMQTALAMINDASEVLVPLLDGGHSTIAGKLAGAFRRVGREKIAENIIKTMQSAGFNIREVNPFEIELSQTVVHEAQSPYANRIRIMWQQMRSKVIEFFPEKLNKKINIHNYLKTIEENYLTDAYHSLSIEGYQVNEELINKVRTGQWNPDKYSNDLQQHNAMAARGYWQSYQAVRESIEKVLNNQNAGVVAYDDHDTWYREMFAPSVVAGLLNPVDLAGYRNSPVYIRQSMHVPPNSLAVRDCMPVLFELLKNETKASVRAVLGHFVFVYIHPYVDGNGRMGRFLMNLMLASGSYPWIVIPVEQRGDYMQSLEQASVHQNIVPFTQLIAGLMKNI